VSAQSLGPTGRAPGDGLPVVRPAGAHTTAASGRTVAWLLDLRATDRAQHPFIVWEPFDGPTRTYTYAEFAYRVRRVAAGLRRRGAGRGDRVIIHLDNCPEFLMAWFACTRIGAVAVSTSTRSAAEELTYFGEHSGAVAAVTQPGLADRLGSALPGLRWIAVTAADPDPEGAGAAGTAGDPFESLMGDEADGAPADLGSFDPAWIQYTSGTTSRPKAVVLTHANALWSAKVSAQHETLTAADVHLVHLPLFHINALCYSTLASLFVGGTAVVQPRFSASRFWEVAVRNGCTWTSVAPFCVRSLLEREAPADHRFRLWGNGYSGGPEDARFGIRTLAWYGLTETVSHAVIDEPETPGHPFGMGRPAPEYRVRVVDAEGRPVEPGQTGSVLVQGVPGLSLFAGYLHDEAATAAAVDAQGWLTTGDRATVHDDGYLSFADRDKDMLKVGGENVAASEIERVVMEVPGVVEVAVVGAPDRMLDEVPVAFVVAAAAVGDDRRPELAEAVLAACRQRLSDFKVPRQVRVVDDMPRSTLNKIAKAELRRALRDERSIPAVG
jgi:crotonobetaine/carnitine-CoA ligase